jgi:hypothetical protein
VDVDVTGEIWFWRGPAPWCFVTVPADASASIEGTSRLVSYGWGMIPVTARLGRTTWTTSLFPKDGHYLIPMKAAVRRAERVDVGDRVTVRLTVDEDRDGVSSER